MSLRSRSITAVSVVAAVLVIDQIIKFAVKTSMYVGEKVDVTSWFKIFFVENRGMAFGMEFVGTFALALFRVIAIGVFAYVLWNIVRKRAPFGLIICWACVVAGAAGNIIDNCFYGLIFSESGIHDLPIATTVPFGDGYGSFLTGKVVDMFYFPLFTWPDWMPLVGGDTFFGAVFNFADAAISCGAVALILFYRRYLTGSFLFRRNETAAVATDNEQHTNNDE